MGIPTACNRRFRSRSPLLVIAALAAACSPPSPPEGPAEAGASADTVTLRYFGAAGWELAAAREEGADPLIVLVDPYLTRAKYATPASWDPSDTRPTYTRADTLTPAMFDLMEGNCPLFFIGLEAVTEAALEYMNKADSAAKYMAKMRTTMERCFAHGVTPQLGVIPNYPKNTKADVEAIFSFLDELHELHARMCPSGGAGFLMTVFDYHIWYGLPHQRNLAALEALGMTWEPSFPASYHGEPVPVALRRDVRDASAGYSWDEYCADKLALYGKGLRTPRAEAHLADRYNMGFVNAAAGRIVRLDGEPVTWTDDEQNVLDVKAMHDARIAAAPGA